MKKRTSMVIYPFLLLGVLLIITCSCKKSSENNNNPPSNTVTDIDGNVYHTVTIGTQIWIVENLKTTKYRNGDLIPNVTDDNAWDNLTSGACCDLDNTPGNSTIYGKLYNWYAVHDSRNISPIGWHIPSDTEWSTLITFLGGENIAGGKLKATGSNWTSPNTGATNETGFMALPGGGRTNHGPFWSSGDFGSWWTTTDMQPQSIIDAWLRSMSYDHSSVDREYFDKRVGISVRCVKD